jgi:hypothetical protein
MRDSGQFVVTDLSTGQTQPLAIPGLDAVQAAVFSPAGWVAAVVGPCEGQRCAGLWDIRAGQMRPFPRADFTPAMSFSPDGQVFAAACPDGAVRLYSVPDANPLAAYRWDIDGASALALSGGGRWLATHAYGVIKLWPLQALLSNARSLAGASG